MASEDEKGNNIVWHQDQKVKKSWHVTTTYWQPWLTEVLIIASTRTHATSGLQDTEINKSAHILIESNFNYAIQMFSKKKEDKQRKRDKKNWRTLRQNKEDMQIRSQPMFWQAMLSMTAHWSTDVWSDLHISQLNAQLTLPCHADGPLLSVKSDGLIKWSSNTSCCYTLQFTHSTSVFTLQSLYPHR